MDIGLQLSFTESFNIVSADFVNHGVPIVVSDAIKWLPFVLKTSTVTYEETIEKMIWVYKWRNSGLLRWWARLNLVNYNIGSKEHWSDFMKQFNKQHSHH
jgi:hypothetical protein